MAALPLNCLLIRHQSLWEISESWQKAGSMMEPFSTVSFRGFMIQGGDPEGTGYGGSKDVIPDEFGDGLTFDEPGILAMANAGPNTGRSQFFITVAPTPWLQNHHAIFGKVTEHYDVVQTISRASTDWRDKPVEDVVVEKITIREAE